MKKEDRFTENQFKKFARGTATIESEDMIQNCVIYTRVSSKEQMETNKSLEWQKKFCEDYAIKNNLNVAGYFGGTYESAKSDERLEFTRMLKFVKSSKQNISLILVYSLDRFSRTGDSAIYISSELKKTGVNIIAVTSPTDTKTHAGTLQQNIQFIFSKYDNDLRRQKTIDGMRAKLLRGEWIGNAPTGYQIVKGAIIQTIIISEKGEPIKQAFVWRANGMTYQQIILKLKAFNLTITKQTLTGIFRNPFYCGFMSHSLLNGDVIKGNHPALITKELFLKVNSVKSTIGFSVNIANDNLPLKVFVKDAETKVPFTGYIVQKKRLYYYKVNKVGVNVNRSAKIMHKKFRELLSTYTINPKYIEPLKIQLSNTFENLNESNSNEKKSLANKLNEVDNGIYSLRKRHALGTISLEVYDEFISEMKAQKEAILDELNKHEQKLSNPKELINFACNLASNLPSVWDSGNFYQKQSFQNTLFPEGLFYDAKKEHYRTPILNSVFGCILDITNDLEGIKKSDSQNIFDKSDSVPGIGLEPIRP